MPRWQVSMEVADLIEAATAEEAIEKANDHGYQWTAVDIDRTAETSFVTAAVLVNEPAAIRWVAGVCEWDNGWWYDHYNVTAVLPDGGQRMLEFDVDHPLHKAIHDALTELSERDGPLVERSELVVKITDEQRAAVYCRGCAAVIEPDGWDDAGVPIWSERVNDGWSESLCDSPELSTHVPANRKRQHGDLDIPLGKAEGELRDLLIGLAEWFEDDPARPCCDAETTLRDWVDSGLVSGD